MRKLAGKSRGTQWPTSVMTPAQKFYRSVTVNDGHLLWRSDKRTGYMSRFYSDGSRYNPRVWVWEYEVGEIPNGFTVRESCGTYLCVNVKHLELVRDKSRKLSIGDVCRNGHTITKLILHIRKDGQRSCLKCVSELRKNPSKAGNDADS